MWGGGGSAGLAGSSPGTVRPTSRQLHATRGVTRDRGWTYPCPMAEEKEPASSSGDAKADPASEAQPKVDPSKLSPEEQMALYEEQLKEDDWGHQPC